MKIRFLPICASSALLLAGCAVEESPMEGGSIAAVMEDIQTRTAVTDEGTFTWSSGDQVWLEITANPGYVTGTLSSGAGTGSANFSYGTYFGDMTGKAVYPFNSGHDVNGDELSVVLPASYDLGTNLSNTNAAMYGVETGGNIKFNHLAGVMRFKFRNAPAGTDRFILTLDKKINGTFTADLTEDHPVLRTESASSASEKSITLNFDPLTSAQDIMLYVPLPLGTYTTLGLEVKAGSQSVWGYNNTVTNTINRKSLILMPTVTLAGSISGDIEGSETPEEPSRVALNVSNEGAGADITIKDVEVLVDGAEFCSSELADPVTLSFGESETIYMDVEGSELPAGTVLTIKVNGSGKRLYISEDLRLASGEVTSFNVPIRPLERETLTDIFELQSAGSSLFNVGDAEQHTAQINGEEVDVYVIGSDSQQSVTIQGTASDLLDALDVGYYAASWKGRQAAMTLENLNIWMPEFNADGSLKGHTQLASYKPIEQMVKDLYGSLTAIVVMPVIKSLIGNGIPRDGNLLYLTVFMDPRKLTFNGLVETSSSDESELSNMIVLDEEPLQKVINSASVDRVLSTGFRYNGYTPTFEGLKAIAQHQSTAEAENTLRAIYGTIKSRLENKTLNLNISPYSIQFPVGRLWDALFESEEDMARKFGDMKFSITLSTYPYSPDKDDYGTIGNPLEPSSPINPVLLWGINAHSESSNRTF